MRSVLTRVSPSATVAVPSRLYMVVHDSPPPTSLSRLSLLHLSPPPLSPSQAWRGAVTSARTPTALMECVLLLEHYVNKQWFIAPNSRLLQVPLSSLNWALI